MICGQDAHGASRGLGCGKGFSWNAAPMYKANIGERKMPEELNVVEPSNAFEIHHEITDGYPLPCDYCGNAIVGPCLRCIHCPALSMCLQCNTNIDFGDRWTEGHNNTHTCKVILNSTTDEEKF
jgi:hypothetical protein